MGSIMTYIGLVLAVWIAYIVLKAFRQNSAIIKEEKRLKKQGINGSMNLIHLEGLDFAEAGEVYFTAGKDIISIASGRKKYAIDIERINNISFDDTYISFGGSGGDGLLEFKTIIINYIGKDEKSNSIVLMPKYSDSRDVVLVKKENKKLGKIINNINYAKNKMNKGASNEATT